MPVKSWTKPANGYLIFQQNPEDGESIYEAQEVRCSVCYSVSKDFAVLVRPQPEGLTEELIIQWVVKLDELANAAENGCQFCSFMASRFFHDPGYMFILSNESNKPVTGCCGASPKSELTKDIQGAITHLRERHAEHPDKDMTLVCQKLQSDKYGVIPGKFRWTATFTGFPFEAVKKILGLRTEIVLELYALKDNPAAEWVKVRPVNINPVSESGLSWAKTCIDECLNKHSNCPGPSTTRLPKRVVQIIDQDNLKIAAGEEIGSYTALSYCWGGPQIFETSTDTLARMSEGFKTSELPQTLRDAVRLTSELGIEYLWIDSLCIIQDSAEDKDLEIPKMTHYYRDAYVTISAGGEKVSDGFLQSHDFCEIHPNTGLSKDLLSMPFLCPNNVVGKIYFRGEKNYCLSDEKISKRAWTLQERMLSPRVLTYGSRVLWQCNTAQHSDGGCEDWSFDLRLSKQRSMKVDFAAVKKTPESNQEDGTNRSGAETIIVDNSAIIDQLPNHSTAKQFSFNASEIWYSAVHEYSFRQLTIPSDKLPAISGIAIALSEISNDEYLAGHWRSNLLRELMWSTYPHITTIPSATWRAPSWSWASLNNHISFDRLPPPSAIPLATVISCTVVPCNPASRFGEIESANLKIRGPMVEMNDMDVVENSLRRENQRRGPMDEDKGLEFRTRIMNFMAFGGPDVDDKDWVRPENAALLILFAEGEEEEDGIDGPGEGILGESVETQCVEVENSKEEQRMPRFKDDKAIASCLVLTRREDGMYERVGSMSTVTLRGMRNALEKVRVVEIA